MTRFNDFWMRSCITWKGVPTLLGTNKAPDSAFWNFIVAKPAIHLCKLHKKSDFNAQEMFLTFSQLDMCWWFFIISLVSLQVRKDVLRVYLYPKIDFYSTRAMTLHSYNVEEISTFYHKSTNRRTSLIPFTCIGVERSADDKTNFYALMKRDAQKATVKLHICTLISNPMLHSCSEEETLHADINQPIRELQ